MQLLSLIVKLCRVLQSLENLFRCNNNAQHNKEKQGNRQKAHNKPHVQASVLVLKTPVDSSKKCHPWCLVWNVIFRIQLHFSLCNITGITTLSHLKPFSVHFYYIWGSSTTSILMKFLCVIMSQLSYWSEISATSPLRVLLVCGSARTYLECMVVYTLYCSFASWK